MSKYTVEDMRVIQPVLEMFDRPEKHLKYRLEETHLWLSRSIEQDINQVGMYKTYCQLNDILFAVVFKLKTLYCAWGQGNTEITDHELRDIVLGINYEIYESFLHTLSMAKVHLPYIRDNQHIWDEYRASLHVYVRRCNVVSSRFGNAVGLKDDIVIEPKERSDLINGVSIPTINLSGDLKYHFGTDFTPVQIADNLDLLGDTGTIHPSITTIMQFCSRVEYLMGRISPDDLDLLDPSDIQVQLLSLITLMRDWDALTLAGLFKDEKILLSEYEIQKKKDPKVLTYQLWRENQLTKLITPDVMVASMYC